MTTTAEVREAETWMERQRLAAATLLQVDYSKLRDEGERSNVARLVAAATEDPAEFVNLVERATYAPLFSRGALYFGEKREE